MDSVQLADVEIFESHLPFAAGVQQGRVDVHPVYFDHDVLYHLIQAVALVLMFRGVPALHPTSEAPS